MPAWLVLVGVGVLSLPTGAAPALAQRTVAVYALEGLRFGQLMPGAAADVRPLSVGNRAELDLVGWGRVTVMFELPEALVSASGVSIPLVFGAIDGLWIMKGTDQETYFDPRQPLVINIPRAREGAWIYLGGIAQPAAGQPAGEYSATITVHTFSPGS